MDGNTCQVVPDPKPILKHIKDAPAPLTAGSQYFVRQREEGPLQFVINVKTGRLTPVSSAERMLKAGKIDLQYLVLPNYHQFNSDTGKIEVLPTGLPRYEVTGSPRPSPVGAGIVKLKKTVRFCLESLSAVNSIGIIVHELDPVLSGLFDGFYQEVGARPDDYIALNITTMIEV